ncbi:MAG: hypothetical protein ACWA6R_06445 [Nitrosomonas sp.]
MKKMILLIVALSIVYMNFFSEKARWDREVDRLCAIDGGIRVYETVRLPSEKFNKSGEINFYRPTQKENTLGTDYIYQWNIHDYVEGHPAVNGAQEIAVRRDHIIITRKSDLKLLGEFVKYHRAGGDVPGPWMPSSYHCPEKLKANESILLDQIFLKESAGDRK